MFKIRKLDLLVGLYIFGVLCSELMGSKTFPLLHIGSFEVHGSVALFVIPLLFMLPDIVVEVYGRARAKSIVYTGLICVALLIGFTFLATHLPPTPRFAGSEPAYEQIFGYTGRIAFASLTAFAVSELLDIAIFSKLRQRMQKRALWFRNIVANVVSQFVDPAIFLTLAFYALNESVGANMSFLLGLLIPYWLLRSALTVIETPLVYAGVWWLRRDTVAAETDK